MTTSRWSSVVAVAAHARVRDALTICIFVLALAAPTLVAMLGEPGATAALVTLCVLASASLVGLRSEIEWRGILPVSLLAFFAVALAGAFVTLTVMGKFKFGGDKNSTR